MNAGLPGTGIGGLFYIAGALLMPFRMLRDAVRRQGTTEQQTGVSPLAAAAPSRRPGRVRPLRQMAIAVGILASLFATGWLLGFLVPPQIAVPRAGGSPALLEVRNAVRLASLLGTVGILLLVLATVEVATLLTRLPRVTVVGRSPATDPTPAPSSSDLSRVA